jgi:hypothetical protein
MNALLLDAWADLRQKRLVPVAAILVVALIAVPLLLIQPAEEPPAPAPAAASASSKQLEPIGSDALVKPAEGSISDGSALDRFLSKDPFKPVESLEDEAGVVAETTDGSGAETADSGGGDTGGGGDSGGTTDGGSGGGAPESTEPDKPAPKKYTYVLDVTFTVGEKSRSIRSLERLELLPSDSEPLLVFLGVTSSGNEAAFIVDSSLTPSGDEGRCKPSPTDCGFVYLEAGEEHSFIDPQGRPYKLRIDQIRKVSVKSLASAAAARARTAASRQEPPLAETPPVVRTAEGLPAERRRISLPFLSDFEIEFGGQE